MTTRKEYLNYKMNPRHTMMVHISTMNNMRLDLKTWGAPLTNELSIECLSNLYLTNGVVQDLT